MCEHPQSVVELSKEPWARHIMHLLVRLQGFLLQEVTLYRLSREGKKRKGGKVDDHVKKLHFANDPFLDLV